MSDWHGSASNTDMVDLEMPGPTTVRGAALLRAVKCGLVTEAEIDERATRVLALAHKAIDSGIPFDAPEHQLDTSEVRALQRQAAADSIVLLKNDGNLLPLPTEGIKRILVVGSNAAIAAYSGGGSARLFPTRAITPLHGLQEACNALAIEIEHQVGAYGHRYLPEFPLRSPSGKEGVYKVSFFGSEADKEAITSLESRQYDLNFDDMDASVPRRCFALLEADFEVDQAGEWEFGLATWGTAKLFIDGELLVDNSKSQVRFCDPARTTPDLSASTETGRSFFRQCERRGALFDSPRRWSYLPPLDPLSQSCSEALSRPPA